ncbi:hypothetical protein KQI65_10035 [bacterium]|nr:hypothetical protein [bacterium]
MRTPSVSIVILAVICCTLPLHAQTQRQVLLEEFSTAVCGFCPDGGLVAEQIAHDHPSVIWVTHHAGFGVDSMTTPESKGIASAFTNFAPSALIDRGVYPVHVAPYLEEYGKIGTTRSKWDSVVTARLGDEQYARLDITTSYNAATTTLNCSIDIVFSTVPEPGDIRVNMFLVEDSVIGTGSGFDQKNYYDGSAGHPYYQAGNPILGFVHRRVVSAVPTGTWGVAGIVPPSPETGVTYTYSWSGSLMDVWNDCNIGRQDAISVVAFLSYYDEDIKKRQVIHAAEAQVDARTIIICHAPGPQSPAILAWPNPSHDLIRLSTDLPAGESGRLVVTDAAGRQVAQYDVRTGRNLYTLDASALPSGSYLYCLFSSSSPMVTGRLQVLH